MEEDERGDANEYILTDDNGDEERPGSPTSASPREEDAFPKTTKLSSYRLDDSSVIRVGNMVELIDRTQYESNVKSAMLRRLPDSEESSSVSIEA